MVSDLIVAAKRDITKLFRQSEYFVMVEKYKKKRKQKRAVLESEPPETDEF